MNILSFTLRRSGTHPIGNWILAQKEWSGIYFHNVTMSPTHGVQMPQAILTKVDNNGMLLPIQVPVLTPHNQKNRKLISQFPELAHVIPYTFEDPYAIGDPVQEGSPFFGGKLPPLSFRYYGFENVPLGAVLMSEMWDYLDPTTTRFIIGVRDPLDNIASLMAYGAKESKAKESEAVKSGQGCGKSKTPPTIGTLPSTTLLPTSVFAQAWKNMSLSYLADYGVPTTKIRYDLFCSSRKYRDEKAAELGIENKDLGRDNIPKAGGGSSHDGHNALADQVRGRSKGRELYRFDAQFKNYVDTILIPTVNEEYKSIFGRDIDPTENHNAA